MHVFIPFALHIGVSHVICGPWKLYGII